MNTTPNPGLRQQSGARTVFRVLGVVLAPVGAVVLGTGFYRFATTDPGFDPGFPPGLGMFILGALMLMVGVGFLNAGFMGVAARYGAGETMPVVKDSAAYLTDGEGLLGVGRTVDDAPVATTGPFCRSCGVRNDESAKFCDGCGTSLT